MTQAKCPSPGCTYSTEAPGAAGWSIVGGRWWCPLHMLGEQRRLQEQEREISWYDARIRVREEIVKRAEADKERVRTYARTHQMYPKDPEILRRMSVIDDRTNRAERELEVLRKNREDALRKHRKS